MNQTGQYKMEQLILLKKHLQDIICPIRSKHNDINNFFGL